MVKVYDGECNELEDGELLNQGEDENELGGGLDGIRKNMGVFLQKLEERRGQDERLFSLLKRIQQDVLEVNSLVEDVRKGGIVPELVTSDLNHIMEIEYDNLTDEQRLLLLKYKKQASDFRRINKNIFTVGNILGEDFKKLDKYFEEKMAKVEGVLDTGNKHYRIKGLGVSEIFEDIMGTTIEDTKGRYIDLSDHVNVYTGVITQSGKTLAYEARKKYKKEKEEELNQDEESKEVITLSKKELEREIWKVSGRKKKRNKKKKK